jgi:hypothetical protein
MSPCLFIIIIIIIIMGIMTLTGLCGLKYFFYCSYAFCLGLRLIEEFSKINFFFNQPPHHQPSQDRL